jgi:hypothetical protein
MCHVPTGLQFLFFDFGVAAVKQVAQVELDC